jgi:hypothetical protein
MSHLPSSTLTSTNDKFGGVSKAKYYRDRKKRAFNEIETQGNISYLACIHCFEHGIRCVVMSSTKSSKCASCQAKGIKCVNVSWHSLDKTREQTKAEINADLLELERITARLAKNRRVLELAEKRAKAKAICLLDELEEEEERQRLENGGLTDAELEDMSRDFVAHTNASENVGTEVWSAWDSSRGGPDVGSEVNFSRHDSPSEPVSVG